MAGFRLNLKIVILQSMLFNLPNRQVAKYQNFDIPNTKKNIFSHSQYRLSPMLSLLFSPKEQYSIIPSEKG